MRLTRYLRRHAISSSRIRPSEKGHSKLVRIAARVRSPQLRITASSFGDFTHRSETAAASCGAVRYGSPPRSMFRVSLPLETGWEWSPTQIAVSSPARGTPRGVNSQTASATISFLLIPRRSVAVVSLQMKWYVIASRWGDAAVGDRVTARTLGKDALAHGFAAIAPKMKLRALAVSTRGV